MNHSGYVHEDKHVAIRGSLILFALFCGLAAFFSLSLLTGRTTAQQSSAGLLYLPAVFHEYRPPQWEHVGLSGTVTDIHLDPLDQQHAYASVYFEGLFETTDGGSTWVRHEQITARLNDIEADLLRPAGLYVATWGLYTMYHSETGQPPWMPVPGWSQLFPLLQSMIIHPQTPTLILAGAGSFEGNGGVIYKSLDEGVSWYSVSPQHVNALTFAVDPFAPQVIYAGSQFGGVWKSIDGGEQWIKTSNGMPDDADYVRTVLPHPEIPLLVYAATEVGLYVTYDGAESWSPLWTGIDANALIAHPDDPDTLFLGTSEAIFMSRNGGLNWSGVGRCGSGLPIGHLTFLPNGDLWAGTGEYYKDGSGLWRCTLH